MCKKTYPNTIQEWTSANTFLSACENTVKKTIQESCAFIIFKNLELFLDYAFVLL